MHVAAPVAAVLLAPRAAPPKHSLVVAPAEDLQRETEFGGLPNLTLTFASNPQLIDKDEKYVLRPNNSDVQKKTWLRESRFKSRNLRPRFHIYS